MTAIKSRILRIWDTAPPGIRICCIKFAQRVVFVQTPAPEKDVRIPQEQLLWSPLLSLLHAHIALAPRSIGHLGLHGLGKPRPDTTPKARSRSVRSPRPHARSFARVCNVGPFLTLPSSKSSTKHTVMPFSLMQPLTPSPSSSAPAPPSQIKS